MQGEGSWIFLSHSSKDIKIVREIRNEFERLGENPLAFHLRCLSVDTQEKKEELINLIHREIDAREWFVFCESENSSMSEYVQDEQNYVKEVARKKKIFKLDLKKSKEKIFEDISKIVKYTRVHISCSEKDSDIAKRLQRELEKYDYEVYLNPGCDRTDTIDKSAFFIAVITNNYFDSYSSEEFFYAKQNIEEECFLPLVFGNVDECDISQWGWRLPPVIGQEDYASICKYFVEIENFRHSDFPMYFSAALQDEKLEVEEKLNYCNNYHLEGPIEIRKMGAREDYCSVWKFPCCGKIVVAGDKKPTRYCISGCSSRIREIKNSKEYHLKNNL